jgi:tRNA threonylcarbamoyladenosine modification (KEOPS) complex  Pcc1 subunit
MIHWYSNTPAITQSQIVIHQSVIAQLVHYQERKGKITMGHSKLQLTIAAPGIAVLIQKRKINMV